MRKKPVPATLHPAVLEQLGPLDPLRLRFVKDDARVRDALALIEAHDRELAEARKLAKSSAEAVRAYKQAVQARADLVRDLLEPAVRDAERTHALVAAAPHDVLAKMVVQRVDGDTLLAMVNLLRRKPHWQDPALWNARIAPENVRYLAHTVSTEAHYVHLKHREADESAVTRGERPFHGPSETAALRIEQARQKRLKHGLRLMRKLRSEASLDMVRVLDVMASERCGPFAACTRLRLPRSTAVALRARADRLLSKPRKIASA